MTSSTATELAAAVHGARLGLHDELASIFQEEVFADTKDLITDRAAALTYKRLRYLANTFGLDRRALTDPQRFFALQEWAAIVDPALAALIAIHLNLCIGTIHALATPSDNSAREVLDRLERFEVCGAFLGTEVAAGADLGRVSTEARYQRPTGDFVLTTVDGGGAKFLPNSSTRHAAKVAVVLARLIVDEQDHGVHAFLCELGGRGTPAPGVDITLLPEKPALWVDNSVTVFRSVRLPREALLHDKTALLEAGEPATAARPDAAYRQACSRLHTGRVGMSAMSVSMARAAVTAAVRFAEHRMVGGAGRGRVPVIEHRSHHTPLLDIAADTYAMTMLVNAAMRLTAEESGSQAAATAPLRHLAALSKSCVTRHVNDILAEAARLCASHGLFAANRFPQYRAANNGCMLGEGENTVITMAATQEMILGHGYEPPPAERYDPDLPDDMALITLARRREHDATAYCRALLKRERESGLGFFHAWNKCALGAMRLADRYTHRRALEELFHASGQATGQAGELLRGLARLYALRDIERDASSIAAAALLTKEFFASIPSRMDGLYSQLAPHLGLIVDGFAITESLLDIPAASASYLNAYCERGET